MPHVPPLFSDKQQALTCREAARFQSKSCWPDSYTVHSNKFIICLPELKLLTIFCPLSSLPCFCCLHGILFVRPGPPTNSRVEWFSPFYRFSKMDTLLPISYSSMSSIPTNLKIWPCAALAAKFKKSQGLQNEYFILTICKYLTFKNFKEQRNSKF